MLAPWKKSYNKTIVLKSWASILPKKVHLVKAMVFLVVMYRCKRRTTKKADCQGIDAYDLWCWRRLLRVPWTARRSNQSILKEINAGYSSEAEAPILWPLDVKNWPIGKDPVAGKDWGQEEKGATEDEMVGWHHRLNGHEFEQTLGDSEGQGSLACCSPWGHKELDMTEQMNKTAMNFMQKNKAGKWARK